MCSSALAFWLMMLIAGGEGDVGLLIASIAIGVPGALAASLVVRMALRPENVILLHMPLAEEAAPIQQ